MSEATISVDMYGSLDENGVHLSLFFGDNCDPSIEKSIDWKEIIEEHVTTYTVPSRDYIPYDNKEMLDEPFAFVRALRVVADNIEERLMSLDAMDRQAWLEANDGNFGGPVDEFLKPMKEVLND